jgi:hypothetical protein
MKKQIEQDIWKWITDYVEVNHEFYDYKFPPCPYARAARLKGLVEVSAWTQSSKINFIRQAVNNAVSQGKINTLVMVFPPWFRWCFITRWFIKALNKHIIPKDFYIQYGGAVETQSIYPGVGAGQPYVVVILNRVSDVLAGHKSLSRTNYYDKWGPEHYHNVVDRRQQMIDKYRRTK